MDDKAWEDIHNAREAYRKGEISDDEFLAAKKAWDENQHKFDIARGEA